MNFQSRIVFGFGVLNLLGPLSFPTFAQAGPFARRDITHPAPNKSAICLKLLTQMTAENRSKGERDAQLEDAVEHLQGFRARNLYTYEANKSRVPKVRNLWAVKNSSLTTPVLETKLEAQITGILDQFKKSGHSSQIVNLDEQKRPEWQKVKFLGALQRTGTEEINSFLDSFEEGVTELSRKTSDELNVYKITRRVDIFGTIFALGYASLFDLPPMNWLLENFPWPSVIWLNYLAGAAATIYTYNQFNNNMATSLDGSFRNRITHLKVLGQSHEGWIYSTDVVSVPKKLVERIQKLDPNSNSDEEKAITFEMLDEMRQTTAERVIAGKSPQKDSTYKIAIDLLMERESASSSPTLSIVFRSFETEEPNR